MHTLKKGTYTFFFSLLLAGNNSSIGSNNTFENATVKHSIYSKNTIETNDLILKEITQEDFERYSQNYKTSCHIGTDGFINGYDLIVSKECDEICETYLVEKSSGKKSLMPSHFDEGLMGMLFSPSCNQFLIFSSYDGPDYEDYYSHRAEIIGFKVTKEEGLKAVKSSFTYKSKDWSIAELIWINNTSIAIKTYQEARWGDGSNLNYKYYKLDLNK